MDFGIYWLERKSDFPKRELHVALVDASVVHFDVTPLRAWLVSEAGDIVVQIQHDRLYVNWRQRSAGYPRFSDDQDGGKGLKHRALAELAQFRQFCTGRGVTLNVQRVELTKIDILKLGTHYSDAEDLTRLLRVAESFRSVQAGQPLHCVLQFAETHPQGVVQLSVTGQPGQVRIETRVVSVPTSEISATLDWANERANHVFFGLLEDDSLVRFQGASHEHAHS